MTLDADAELMLSLQRGDEKAFDEIFRRFHRRVLHFVGRTLGSTHPRLEDLTQETFLRVYRARESYEPKAKFSTWLFRIAINLCLTELSRERPATFSALEDEAAARKDSTTGDSGPFEPPDTTTPLPEEALETLEASEMLKRSIERLPERQRIAILLSNFEAMTYEEIAETLDVSLSAVKSLLFRAREALHRDLRRYFTS